MEIVFGSQSSDAPSECVYTHEKRIPRRKWSPTEDVVLINAWLNTTKNPILANDQKFEAFWERIASDFASSTKLAGLLKRDASCCKQRWKKIDDSVCKFVGCYVAATIYKSSGQNENDVMKLANEIYFNDHKVKFALEHAWRVLRHEPKWCASSSTKRTKMAKRRKCEEGSAQSSSSHPVLLSHGGDEAMPRPPPDVNASKGKATRYVTNTATVVEEGDKSQLEFRQTKQNDFALKEKISRHKLLGILLTKTEPLSEMEMALKNKLISDMLSS